MNNRKRIADGQRTTIVYGVLCIVLTLVVLQLWLLTATMNAYLGGDHGVVIPALGASLICFAFTVGLIRSMRTLEQDQRYRR